MRRTEWYENSIFNIHFDHHVGTWSKEVGTGGRVDEIVALLERSKPTAIQFHSKGHPGYATYPTKAGTPHPGLKCDLMRIYKDAASKLGIKFLAYYSGAIDNVVAEAHPDWCRTSADGKVAMHDAQMYAICLNSPYTDEVVLPMLKEIMEWYEPDGFWFDGDNWSVRVCYCSRCRRLFKEHQGAEPPEDPQSPLYRKFTAFQRETFVNYLKKCADFIHKTRPQCMFASNWAYTAHQPDPAPEFLDWLSGDIPLPHGPIQASFHARFLTTRGKPFDIMTCNYLIPGWNWGTRYPKTAAHLLQEGAAILANGGRWFLWDHPRDDGSLSPTYHKIVEEVARLPHEGKEVFHGTTSYSDVAVLLSAETHYAKGNGLFDHREVLNRVRGAHRSLIESHFHIDIVDEKTVIDGLGRYRTVVIPEQTVLPEETVDGLTDFIEGGGSLITTGETAKIERLRQLLGIKMKDAEPVGIGWLPAATLPVPVGKPWLKVEPEGAEVAIWLLKNGDELNQEPSDSPAVTVNKLGKGKAVYVATDIFSAYYDAPCAEIRNFIAQIMDIANPVRLIETDAPPRVEISLRQKKSTLIVHLVNHGAGKDLSENSIFLEEVPPVGAINLGIKCQNKPASVALFPDKVEPKWKWDGERVKIAVPGLKIHAAVILEGCLS